jgi:hypothetical protein
VWRLGGAFAAIAAVLLGTPVGAVQAAGTAGSGASIVAPTTDTPIVGPQPSTAPFVILLPRRAGCTHSTSASGYHVQTFLVEATAGVPPSRLVYEASGPTIGLPLWTPFTPYANANTNHDGTIPEPTPTFSWRHFYRLYLAGGRLAVGHLHAGVWNLGISCSDAANGADNYWALSVEIDDSSTDPHGFTWKVLQSSTPPAGASSPAGALPPNTSSGSNQAAPVAGDSKPVSSAAPGHQSGELAGTGPSPLTRPLLWLAALLIVSGLALFEVARELPRA